MTPQSIVQINATIISDIETQISQSVPLLPVAFVRVLAKAFGGSLVLLYKYTGFVSLQTFVASASIRPTTINGISLTPLIEWGRLIGVGDPLPATPAELTIEIVVTDQTGDPIPAGTQLVYEPTGVIYLTQTTILRDDATKLVNIVATSDQSGGSGVGAVGNIPVGATVSFTSPLIDLGRDAAVTVVVTTGADAEDLDLVYRQRVVDRFQKRPQGGALADLEGWAEETPGIINAYPYTDLPGSVAVYCEADVESSGSPDGFPTQPQLDDALESIEVNLNGRATRRPANMFVSTLSITRREFSVEVVSLAAPDLPKTKSDIEDGMAGLFASFEPRIGGLTITPRDRVTQTEVGAVCQDIARSNNATISSVILRAANTAEASFSVLVSDSADDASQTGSTVTIGGSTLALIEANTIGVRWVNINVPNNATVLSATLTMTGQAVKNVYSVVSIRGEADEGADAFAATANNITSRVSTIATVEWIPTAWAVDGTNEIDVTAIIAEIIAVPGWTALSSIVLILASEAGSDREAYSYDDDPSKAPRITINYSDPTGPFVAQEVVTLARGEKAKVTSVTFP